MSGERILIVDDESDLASSCQRMLQRKGYQAAIAGNGREALEQIAQTEPNLVITDFKMPVMGGMQLLEAIKEDFPEIQVLMMTAFSTIEDAVEAMRLGAADFVPKPFTPDQLLVVVEKALVQQVLREENRYLKEQFSERYSFDNIIGKSPAMRRIFAVIEKIAATDINVLVSGASGTGKELIARSIHAHSPRSERVFVPINCGALPEHLVESEIFGHERGAFTGAIRAKTGLLETAHGGTFFLDEIGELPQALQVKFLRVLQDGKFRRLGSTEERKVDIRLICATNQDLEAMVAEGTFREDLFYRINTFAIDIPPLKERPDDIPLMIEHAVTRYGAGAQQAVEGVAPEAMRLLLQHEWQGNVRELEHAVERAVILCSEGVIQPEDLPPNVQQAAAGVAPEPAVYVELPFKEAKARLVEDFERHYIAEVLEQFGGNISRAAIHSGIDRRSLHRLLAKYEIDAKHRTRESTERAI